MHKKIISFLLLATTAISISSMEKKNGNTQGTIEIRFHGVFTGSTNNPLPSEKEHEMFMKELTSLELEVIKKIGALALKYAKRWNGEVSNAPESTENTRQTTISMKLTARLDKYAQEKN
jgi:hypothetical protein